MSESHEVKPGEHVPRLAAAAGFGDINPIWNDPNNADLKKKRKPTILNPGDTVFIPDKIPRTFKAATGQEHPFVVKRPRIRLRLALADASGRPIANVDCKLVSKGDTFPLKTDGDGKIDQEIAIDTEECKLTFQETEIQLLVGHLTPIEETTGVRGRLNNLGYHAGAGKEDDDDDDDDLELVSAIEEFQLDNGIKPTGEVDGPTRDKLLAVHGC